MRGALKITFTDGTEEYFEVDPVGDVPDFVERFDAFLSRPTITLVMDDEIVVVPSSSIRQRKAHRRLGQPTRVTRMISLNTTLYSP
jgi:hypothetical protein